jgi:L-threonylcarbamoyladenylate synthase
MIMLSTSGADIAVAAAALRAGALVAFPTETVYGLGADAFNTGALARVFEAKRRPRFDPLIIHIAALDALERVAVTGLLQREMRGKLAVLCEALWPGPLTLVLPKRPEVPGLATAGLPTAAVRFPSHPVAQKLIHLSSGAVAAPSANPFGCLSPTRASHVRDQLGGAVDYIIDGGRTTVGVESTVLDLSGERPRILRPGGCSREAIEALIGPVETGGEGGGNSQEAQSSPGQLKSHYAPRTPLILYANGTLAGVPPRGGEGRLYFASPIGGARTAGEPDTAVKNLTASHLASTAGRVVRFLSETGDATEAAANLFDTLHEMDTLNLHLIRAEEAPPEGLGAAINDRLRRAASQITSNR